MTDKEKIREEVEKLKSQLLRGSCSSQVAMETRCKEEAYNEVLATLDSLQEEPVSEDLEIAAQQNSDKYDVEDILDKPYHHVDDAFKAGAKWQKEQMKNTLEPDTPATAEEIKKMQDKRRYELEKKVQHEYNSQLQEQYDNGYDDGYKDAEKVAYEKVRQHVIGKAVEWLKQNITYTHPRKGTEECIINLGKFKEAMMED